MNLIRASLRVVLPRDRPADVSFPLMTVKGKL